MVDDVVVGLIIVTGHEVHWWVFCVMGFCCGWISVELWLVVVWLWNGWWLLCEMGI